jgi:hypothetical protein
MRRKKLAISLDVDSALSVMQEIYNDIVEQKNIASTITRKMLTFMKEAEDMSVIGPVIKDQQKILNDCTEKKISLVKLQSTLLKQSNEGKGKGGVAKLELGDTDKEFVEELVKKMNLDKDTDKTYTD